AGGIADALHIEALDLLLEPARTQQQVLARNAAILEVELAPAIAADEAGRPSEAEAGHSALDQHRADPVDPRPETDVDQEKLGLGAVGREDLGAVDPEMRALVARRRLE